MYIDAIEDGLATIKLFPADALTLAHACHFAGSYVAGGVPTGKYMPVLPSDKSDDADKALVFDNLAALFEALAVATYTHGQKDPSLDTFRQNQLD